MADVGHGRSRVGAQRDGQRGARLGRSGRDIARAGAEQREPGPRGDRKPVERVRGRLGPDAEPVAQPGIGIGREAEDRGLIAGEIGETGWTFAGEHRRGGEVIGGGVTRRARTLWRRSRRVKSRAPLDLLRWAVVEAAFFDLDKTVIATSSVMALGGRFYREGLISKRTIMRGIYAQVVYLLLGADDEKMERMREAMLALTKGWDQERVSEIVRETLDDVLTPIIYAEALELIDEHKRAGRKTVIISSSPIETVAPLGEHLGVDDVIATRARLDLEGRYTGELEFYAYGPHKADAIREMAVKDGIDLANSYAYSDSITDLPMLELVGNPVAVNPDRELTRVAREREWDTRWFQHPVRLRDRVPVPPKGPTLAAGSAAALVGTGIVLYVWLRRRALGTR
jgi:HAD superfamily hydrolase (TIGR01490 family)